MHNRYGSRLACLMAAAGIAATALASCAGSDSESLTADAEPSPTVGEVASEDSGPAPIDEALAGRTLADLELGESYEFYADFVRQADEYRTDPDGEAAAALAETVSTGVIRVLDQQRAQDLQNQFFSPTRISSSPNVQDWDESDDQIVVSDCIERTESFEDTNDFRTFVDQTTEIVLVDGILNVGSVSINHSGKPGEGPGCIPEDIGAEAASAALDYMAALFAAQANPAAGVTPELESLSLPATLDETSDALRELAGLGATMDSSGSTMTAEVLGHDGGSIGDNVVVAVCVTLPNGLQMLSATTGEPTREIFEPGTSTRSELELWDIDGSWKLAATRGGITRGECA